MRPIARSRPVPCHEDLPDGYVAVAVMDSACALCCRGARLIARADRSGDIRICPAATPLGQSLLRNHGMDPFDPESWLFLEDSRVHTGLDAMIRIGARVGGVGYLLQSLRLLPRPARDWIYRRIARNRYLFGHGNLCALPDPAVRERLIG